MYTGTLIRDLLVTVEQAELKVREKELAGESELRMLFASQSFLLHDEAAFAGAA
jgi:hypothetical protein